MADAYSEQSYELGYPEGIDSHFWHVARNALVYRRLRELVGEDELVVDVGCGSGVFLGYARQRGLRIHGVEKGPAPVRPELEGLIKTGTDLFDLDPAEKAEIRTILLLDVLEHIEEREEFLNRLWRELPKCRYLLLTVPARRELWSSFDEFWGHHLRYDRPTLESELLRAGYRPLRNSYFFHWVYLASLVLGRLGFQRDNSFSSPHRNLLVRAAHGCLGWITRLESRLVPGFVPGSSILCLAQREGQP